MKTKMLVLVALAIMLAPIAVQAGKPGPTPYPKPDRQIEREVKRLAGRPCNTGVKALEVAG